MTKLRLNFAASEYDHFRDLVDGTVSAEGIDLNCLRFSVEETFARFVNFQEWEVSEMSFGKFVSFISQDNGKVIGLPVFPSRVFRQSSIYVKADSPLNGPEDLAGKKIGIPEWAQTASIYTRGWLVDQLGIPLTDIEWFQSGVNQAGREEKVKLKLPKGVSLTPVSDKSLTELLLKGDVDAVATAHPPQPFEDGDPSIKRLIPNYRDVEEAYFKETNIFPIMHIIALRRDVYEANPWIAMNLYKAFAASKENSVTRALEITATRFPFAWCYEAAERTKDLFGDDFFPYGLEPNRPTLEAFLKYSYDQGICHRKVTPEELFPEELGKVFKV
ncbi:MAG: 4,5-dihydroxyphthalate decarboxylase [Rhodospirillaceae bacterium]|jgi:4,5-dihydroxyphthalate decarboxylase|nr:4,5-dihydroxyphthalate decarboxylase [Rhodospirillaceae bacterium]MBT7954826.1 4,5-dihydroxyphthalate decarboxylase [Rhodospirillaceae bacterium]